MQSYILCTGGAGYIGSHIVLQLIHNNFKVIILDNFSNSNEKIIKRIEIITNTCIEYYNIDLLDIDKLYDLFQKYKFLAVIHCAGYKSVNESIEKPLKYYNNNVIGSLNLFKVMNTMNCKIIVFSSSATVYQKYQGLIDETCLIGPINPYGQTKLITEQILIDLYRSDNTWRIHLLRYFNPVGAHSSGQIGEAIIEPSNIVPCILQVASNQRDSLKVYGNQWDTHDGSGVRDYIHIEDLADGHVASLKNLIQMNIGVCDIYNLGSGKGYSVFELIHYFEKIINNKIPYTICENRPGDLASVIANPLKAEKYLNWKTTRTLFDACNSAWKWQIQNPNGYN